MPYLNLGGRGKMFYKSQGKGSALIFIHGAYGSRNLWNRQISFFSSRYNVITLDLRGHGLSFKPRSGYELDKMVDEVIMLLDHLKIENAVFVGSSMGGVISQMIGIKYPLRVRALVLVGTLAKAAWYGHATEIAETALAGGYQKGITGWFTPQSSEEHIKVALREGSKTSQFFLRGVILQNPNWDIREEISAIRAPTLILVGKGDVNTTPVRESRIIHRKIPHSQMKIVSNSGHLVMLEQSEVFNRTVDEFLVENQL